MDINAAKKLTAGDFIHTPARFNTDGTPMRARVTSIKTWKRSPDRVEVRCKHGMYDHARFDETELDQIELGYGS